MSIDSWKDYGNIVARYLGPDVSARCVTASTPSVRTRLCASTPVGTLSSPFSTPLTAWRHVAQSSYCATRNRWILVFLIANVSLTQALPGCAPFSPDDTMTQAISALLAWCTDNSVWIDPRLSLVEDDSAGLRVCNNTGLHIDARTICECVLQTDALA